MLENHKKHSFTHFNNRPGPAWLKIHCLSALTLIFLFNPSLRSEPVLNYRWFSASAGGLANQVVRDIAQTPDGAVWLATWGGGLSRYDGLEWKTYTVADGLVSNNVRTVVCDPRGGLWIGTVGGISYLNGNRWTAFTSKTVPALKEESVFSILLRKDGTLLFGMAKGFLYAYDPSREAGLQWHSPSKPEIFHHESIRRREGHPLLKNQKVDVPTSYSYRGIISSDGC